MVQGQIMALSAALLCAIGTSLYNRMGESLTSDMIGFSRMFLAVPMSILLVLIFDKGLPVGYPLQSYLIALGSGVIGYFFCDYFSFKAIVGLGARETSVILTLNPALTAVMSLLIFDEVLQLRQIVGMAVTVLGVSLMVIGEKGSSDDKRHMTLKAGLVCAALGAVLQSVADIMSKSALSSIPSVSTNMVRLAGGLVVWIVFGFIKREDFRKQVKVFRDWHYVAMMAAAVAAGPVFGMTLSVGAMELIPVGVVKSLVQTSPVFLILIDLVRGRRIAVLSLVGTLVSVAGVILLF